MILRLICFAAGFSLATMAEAALHIGALYLV